MIAYRPDMLHLQHSYTYRKYSSGSSSNSARYQANIEMSSIGDGRACARTPTITTNVTNTINIDSFTGAIFYY